MTRFAIYNTDTGVDLGVYEGADEAAALDAMARDIGYRDYAEACSVVGVTVEDGRAELQVTPA